MNPQPTVVDPSPDSWSELDAAISVVYAVIYARPSFRPTIELLADPNPNGEPLPHGPKLCPKLGLLARVIDAYDDFMAQKEKISYFAAEQVLAAAMVIIEDDPDMDYPTFCNAVMTLISTMKAVNLNVTSSAAA